MELVASLRPGGLILATSVICRRFFIYLICVVNGVSTPHISRRIPRRDSESTFCAARADRAGGAGGQWKLVASLRIGGN